MYTEGDSWVTSWKQIHGEWYYFDTNGYVLTDTTTPDGYYVDCDGVWTDSKNSSQPDFTFDATTGTITVYNGSDSEVVIPSTINGVKVKTIGNEAFRWCDSITSVTIPDGVTSIEKSAFYGCSNLTSIEDSVFNKCSSLTSIIIPNGVKVIGINEFVGCISLKSITIPNSVTSIKTLEEGPDGSIINPFQDCANATIYVKSKATKKLLVNSGSSASKIIVTT